MPQTINLRAGDTEPLEITIGGTDITNLDALSTAVLYVREITAATNHVDGVSLTVTDSAARMVSFDPVGAKNGGGDAFDAVGDYRAYVKATWADGDITQHPDDENENLRAIVTGTYE